ncbi:glycosyltransferase [Oricola thermophila]|uniref:Glycosyltransferase n=1 Tax=Oricola thermophila TaxID=2742145 RepID=A0A6N1VAG7_9HYPH|nr:glycosyltransferase [Oricola thermophila]QKV17930.1 glycosyltransferase [Oricola thermophila]
MASVDVIVPSYNYARYLPDCVGSALSQPTDDLRVLIIDNASTDESLDVARRLAREDDRVEIVSHETNLGPHASFNEGIDLARADYMIVLCADDMLAPGALGAVVDQLEARPDAAFAFGPELNMGEFERQGVTEGGTRWSVASGGRFIERCCHTLGVGVGFGSVVVRTSLQKKVGHYDASLPYTDDLDMLLRLALHGPVIECSAPIGIRREHDANMSKIFLRKRVADLREREVTFDRFFDRASGVLADAGRMRSVARRRIAEAAYLSAASHMLRGYRAEAAELYRYGLNVKPSSMVLPPLGHILRKPNALKRAGWVLVEALTPGSKTS